jgi:hypothetical protein
MWMESAEKDHTALSDLEKEAIRGQVGRLLASTYFSQSKRSVTFLHYIVDHTLSDDAEKLKERTLGIEIFGRSPDYDTASDPVVRVTASEIRKRLAQYYQEPGHEDELRISLPTGAYIPEFRWPHNGHDHGAPTLGDGPEARTPAETVAAGAGAEPAHEKYHETLEHQPPFPKHSEERKLHPQPHLEANARSRYLLKLALILVFAGIIWAGVQFTWQAMHRSAFDLFWRPVLTTSDSVTLCVADQVQDSGIALRDPADPAREVWIQDSSKQNSFTTVAIDDLNAIVNVASILQSRGKNYTLKGEGTTNLADLRAGPSIFVGAFDNAWTLRLTNRLRYHFSSDAAMTQLRIVDSTGPTQPGWVVDRSAEMAKGAYRDYALVGRFTDINTGKVAIVIAGIGRGGTLAAGQFLTDAGGLMQLERAEKASGGKSNVEVVLSTQIIDGQPGYPKIEAVYFW